MIKLLDLIRLEGLELHNYKIHCATGTLSSPLEEFYAGEFKKWQEYQNQQNFKCDQILSIIHLGGTDWLFAGIFHVDGVTKKSKNDKTWFEYMTTELPGLESLTGRVIVSFNKDFRNSYIWGEKYGTSLFVKEIKKERMTIGDFPGYNKVILPFNTLKLVVRQRIETWKTALENVAGIYLITDKENGKQYIGSAYGDEGLWQRWCRYTENGHGGNKELRDLLVKEGESYINNFQFSILEVIDLNESKDYIISRECHWKDILLSRQFGYNDN